jgi:hypothetical protein
MLVSALTAPVYARSLLKVVFHRKLTFNVTAKGKAAGQDRMWTFRYSLLWAIAAVAVLIVAETHRRPYAMMIAWTAVILSVCLAPVGIWLFDASRGGFRPRPAATFAKAFGKKRHRGRHARPSGRSARPNLQRTGYAEGAATNE